MNEKLNSNDLQTILSHAIAELKQEQGEKFVLNQINLAELERRTNISRGKLRRYKKDGFVIKAHGNTGKKADVTVLTGYTSVIDDFLRRNITNAVVIFERLQCLGYQGGQTQVRVYIEAHQDLIPPKRLQVQPQGNRGRRFETSPGESYQMDWGFVNVETDIGTTYQCACFAMICHHCGQRYIQRNEFTITIYDDDLSKILTTYDVTWSRQDRFCRDQYVAVQPEEHPSALVKSKIHQIGETKPASGFEKFNFEEGLWDE